MSNQNQHQSTFADISQSLSQTNSKLQKTSPIYFICFVLAIILGVFNGINPSELGNVVANSLSEVFIRLFKFVSVPIIGLAICLTIVKLGSDKSQQQLWKRTLFYTLSTTILAAATAAVLYYILQPENIVLEATIMEKYVAKPPSSTPLENSATLCETKAKIPNGNNLIIQEITKYKTLCNASKTFVIASR